MIGSPRREPASVARGLGGRPRHHARRAGRRGALAAAPGHGALGGGADHRERSRARADRRRRVRRRRARARRLQRRGRHLVLPSPRRGSRARPLLRQHAGGEPRALTRRPRRRAVLLTAVLLLVAAEGGGAAMARYKLDLARWARAQMLARPAVHALVGVRDVDERILDEALFRFDAGLRLFHMHAEGMALVIVATTTIAATLAEAAATRRALVVLLTLGGVGY